MAEVKVLHVYKTCFPYTQGGIEEVIRQLTIETTKLGVNNRIICLSHKCEKKEVIQIDGAEVHCYPLLFEIASCGFSLQLFKDFKRHTQWADIIHYQTPWPFADMLHVFNRIKTPSVITYQSDIVRQKYLLQIYKPLMHCFLGQVQTIVASSENYLNSSQVS
ncbi:MAG: glycosyltransferase, partial [Methyloprofundus sp.]|nr:glycosyltransferase [Methyloprofundus sp.]